jgi:hypothetical protein
MTDERGEMGSTRRDVVTNSIFVACTALFPFSKVKFDAKELAKAPPYDEKYVPSADEVAGLGKELLFRELNQFSAELARTNPYYGDPSGPSPSSQYALRSTLNRLGLSSPAETVSDLTAQADGSLVFFGGPNNNDYSRAVLGTGKGSPLLQLIEPKTEGILPCMFRTEGAIQPGTGREPKWDFLIKGEPVPWPDDCLVITVMPNPYSVLQRRGDRIVVLAGRYRASMYAIDHILSDYKILRHLAKETHNWTAWQAVIRVHSNNLETPTGFGEAKTFQIETNFDNATAGSFAGKPLLSNPHIEEAKETLGLLLTIPGSAGRLSQKPFPFGPGLRGVAPDAGNLSSGSFVPEYGLAPNQFLPEQSDPPMRSASGRSGGGASAAPIEKRSKTQMDNPATPGHVAIEFATKSELITVLDELLVHHPQADIDLPSPSTLIIGPQEFERAKKIISDLKLSYSVVAVQSPNRSIGIHDSPLDTEEGLQEAKRELEAKRRARELLRNR